MLLAILIPLVWSFGSTFTGARLFAYRDTASFYYPLYAWTSRCWSRGEVPLWNPQENIGTPVAAEATSAVFYPGQLMFALPLPYPLKFNLYVLGHLLLATLGAFLLARHLLTQTVPAGRIRLANEGNTRDPSAADQERTKRITTRQIRLLAAGLGGISYAFSGAVLFQYCNVVFLVGAAWLPFALLAGARMLTSRHMAWALVLGALLALMVLGGDPQMAYHTGLIVALLAWLQYRATARSPAPSSLRTQDDSASSDAGTSLPRRRHALVLLAAAAFTGVLLSAVQIVPAVALARTSERASLPRAGDLTESLFGRLPSGTHGEQLYDFSVAPWRVAECLWPNVSGRMFPVNQRWLTAARGEDRVWTPTLYLGLMPLLLALTVWRWRSGHYLVRWLSIVALGTLVGSFGWYGLGWLAGELQRAWTGAAPTIAVGEPTGGLYWLMVKLLPGYSYFRYPAKLLVIASLATSLLGGLGLAHGLTTTFKPVCRWLAVLGTCSVILSLGLVICRPWWSAWFRGAVPDELFGPFDARGAWLGVLLATLHTTLLCIVFGWLLGRWRTGPWRTGSSPVRLGQIIVLITAAELAWANGAHVMTAPANVICAPTVLDTVAAASRASTLTPPGTPSEGDRQVATACTQRIYRPPRRRWVPPQWLKRSDRQRGAETIRWDRATLFPKYHLLGAFGTVHSFNTLSSKDYRTLMRVANETQSAPNLLDLLGVRYLVLPADRRWPSGVPLNSGLTSKRSSQPNRRSPVALSCANVRVWENPNALPRAWIVH